MPKASGIGASPKRREDVRFLTGTGNYTDDINVHAQLYVHFLRSDVAHGTLNGVNTAAATAMPGVERIFTGADFEGVGSIPCGWQVTDRHGEVMQEPAHPVLAQGKVRHVGDPIAAVVASSLEAARDAAAAIELDITELPAVVDMKAALADGATKVHDDLTSNLCYDWGFVEENRQVVADAIAGAHHVTTLELRNNRLVANPMEPRVALGDCNQENDESTLYTTSQNPHVIRLVMGAFVLGISEHKLRVVAPDVGGRFGTKIFHYAEEAFCTFAALALRRPVNWTSTRSEAFMSDAHGSDHVTKIELAMDAEGKFLALRTDTHANVGAYLSTFAPSVPTSSSTPPPSPWNTTPATMRRPCPSWRRSPVSPVSRRGKLRGLGVNCYFEACGIAPSSLVGQLGARAGLYESATVRVNATGSISVMTGGHSHGQGHETTFPQMVAEMSGMDEGQIDIVHGYTSKTPMGMGTDGSRSIAVGGSAMVGATEKIIAKAKKIAADLMEASEADVELAKGAFSVAGTDESVAWGDVCLAAYVPHNYPLEDIEPGLEETALYDPANFTYPAGAYAAEVEVDPDTGKVAVVGFAAADDFGNVINPMVVEGQVHGGLAQGIGHALLENCVYDENGQLLSGSHMDYATLRASDVPMYAVDHSCQTPCTHNPLDVKGCGEAEAIGSPPAMVIAVVDALQSGGHDVAQIDMPLSPCRVWAAMNS